MADKATKVFHIISATNPTRDGDAVINNNGLKIVTGTRKLAPKIPITVTCYSGVLSDRYDNPTYYGA